MADDHRTDAQLVRAANEGDEAAFEALYKRYRAWVHGLALRFTGEPAVADDVTQETFLYLLGRFPGFELRAAMTTFLYPAVRHLSVTALRRQRREDGVAGTIGRSIATRDAPPAADIAESLAAAVDALPPAQREVLLLRFVDDLPLQAIAEALQVPPGTVKSRLHHALRALRRNPCTKNLLDD